MLPGVSRRIERAWVAYMTPVGLSYGVVDVLCHAGVPAVLFFLAWVPVLIYEAIAMQDYIARKSAPKGDISADDMVFLVDDPEGKPS